MSKTWETLFQLSSFMKYLISDVIPLENTAPTPYLLNSLFELLNVTLQTIQIIKSKSEDNSVSVQKFFHEQLESKSSKVIRDFQNNTRAPGNVKNEDDANNHISKTCQSNDNCLLTLKNDNRQNNQTLLKQVDRTLPNDKTLLKQNVDWAQECSSLNCDQPALNSMEDQIPSRDEFTIGPGPRLKKKRKNNKKEPLNTESNEEISHDSNINHHQENVKASEQIELSRYSPSESCSTDCSNNSHNTKKQNKNFQKDPVYEKLKKVGSKLVIHQSMILNKNYIFLNELIFSESDGYGCYCIPCDKCFFSEGDWLSHESTDSFHINKRDRDEFDGFACKKCRFLVIGIFSLANVYFDYHNKLHNLNEPNDELGNVNPPPKKVEPLKECTSANTQKTEPPKDFHTPITKKVNSVKTENKNIVKSSFIDFNARIHSERISKAFSCLSCNVNGVNWGKHINEKIHVLKNSKHNNYEAICNVCGFLVFGYKHFLEAYMAYHFNDHNCTPSFKLYKSCINNKESINLNPQKSDSQVKPEVSKPFVNTAASNSSLPKPLEPQSMEKSFNLKPEKESSNGNSVTNLIKDMRLAQKKIKLAGKNPSFLGYCCNCDTKVEDAFEWMDHLDSSPHQSRSQAGDEEMSNTYYNLFIFGNKLNFENLVK